MALPVRALATGTVEVNGVNVEFRSLSRHECMHVLTETDPDAAENYTVSKATGETLDASAAWLDGCDVMEGKKLVDAILTLSGIGRADGPKG